MQSPLIRAGNNTFSHTVHQLEHNPPDTLNPSYRFAKASSFSYNNQTMSNHTPFYEKFIKKPAQQRNTDNVHTPLHNSSALEQKHKEKTIPHEKPAAPQHVHKLFHELTDERSSRKTQYLNNPVKLSAYTHYYVWWNLIRLVKLLQNIDILLENGDHAADFGSGPLTFVCALWIAKPELRRKQLSWYCVDISHRALNFGEELFLTLCAYTGKNAGTTESPWRIKKICGAHYS